MRLILFFTVDKMLIEKSWRDHVDLNLSALIMIGYFPHDMETIGTLLSPRLLWYAHLTRVFCVAANLLYSCSIIEGIDVYAQR